MIGLGRITAALILAVTACGGTGHTRNASDEHPGEQMAAGGTLSTSGAASMSTGGEGTGGESPGSQ